MLTKICIKNFKRFASVEIELGQTVVFVGPNNAGKTTALQALALWNLGVRRLAERYGDKEPPEKRPGLAINRKDLLNLPVPTTTLLWRRAHAIKQTKRIRIEIDVEGISGGVPWRSGLEFDYDNEESVTCRPLRLDATAKPPKRMAVPAGARATRLAYLPPMSGLVSREDKLEAGSISVRIGEGRTAEVLRNLCFKLYSENPGAWRGLVEQIERLFGARLADPQHLVDRGEIEMDYAEDGVKLDLSSAGRGLQQTLLLLAYMHANPNSVLLLDEPDAHLEILRQRQIYELLTETARATSSQLIAASHSEVLLNEAADRDMVIAFVGKPHRIDDRGDQVRKALREIGFEHYYQAERAGWVLYLEGSTDLEILRQFAARLEHPAGALLERPFVHYVGNQIQKAREHFYGLRAAKPDLVGVAILDRDAKVLPSEGPLLQEQWQRNEIENYLPLSRVLPAFAKQSGADGAAGPLFASAEASRREALMAATLQDLVSPAALRDANDPSWRTAKASALLDRIFDRFYAGLGLENMMRKTNYHRLAALVPREEIDPEVPEKLDAIVRTAASAKPLTEDSGPRNL